MHGKQLMALAAALASAAAGLAAIAPAAEPEPLSGKLLVLAAASTIDALDELRAAFVREHPRVTIRTSYGGSSTLARQIESGGQADLFLSASVAWADYLDKKKLVAKRRDLLSNRLVVVVPADSQLKLNDLGGLAADTVRRLAMADPKSVPAGVYARQALEKSGAWKHVERKVTGAADVRQALALVETGAAEAGIVYATDAAASRGVRVVLQVDAKLTEPIRYPLVLLNPGAGDTEAEAFYDYLGSPAAAAVFRRHGFRLVDRPPQP